MKSKIKDLHQRGYFDKQDLLSYESLSNEEVWKMMHAIEPHQASIAIYMCYQRGYLQCSDYIDYIINRLYTEKKLYTKITICDILSNGNDTIAKKLMLHLGSIGHNQHTKTGKTSQKKCYPIARDIIARTMAKMNLSTTTLLSLFHVSPLPLREAIDFIGYQLYYHPEINAQPFFHNISTILQDTQDDVLIWKCLTCLSAISLPCSIQLLKTYELHEQSKFQKEAKRSLSLIKERNQS